LNILKTSLTIFYCFANLTPEIQIGVGANLCNPRNPRLKTVTSRRNRVLFQQKAAQPVDKAKRLAQKLALSKVVALNTKLFAE